MCQESSGSLSGTAEDDEPSAPEIKFTVAETLTATVNLISGAEGSSSSAVPERDPDDSWHIGNSAAGPGDGPRLVLTGNAALRAGEDVSLEFAVQDEAGQ